MNFARVAAAAVAAWVVSLPIEYVVNDIILKDMYTANAAAFRPEEVLQANLPIGFAFMFVGFFAFAYTYAKGYEGTDGVMEGVRFGVLVAILLNCFGLIWSYVTTPISGSLVVAMMIATVVDFAIYGAVVGAIYKPIATPARKTSPV